MAPLARTRSGLPLSERSTQDAPQPAEYDAYHQGLRRKGRGRIEMGVTVMSECELAATFAGTFVAIRHDEA